MGAEDYLIEAFFDGKRYRAIQSALEECGFVSEPAPYGWDSSKYFVREDPNCYLESQLDTSRIALRYAVCQSAEANRTLAQVIWHLKPFISEIKYPDAEQDPQLDTFESVEALAAWIHESSAEKRRLWFGSFSGRQRKCRCNAAFDEIIKK